MEETVKKTRGRGRGAARSRGRGKGRGRGRGRGKAAAVVESDEEQMQEDADDSVSTIKSFEDASAPAAVDKLADDKSVAPAAAGITVIPVSELIAEPSPGLSMVTDEKENEIRVPPTIDMEADISQLEAPTFTTISRGPPEPMTRLKWDHKVNLIGEKVLNPMIHCCDQCENVKPILIYGRMIPCKHVFCLKCGREEPIKSCPRCKEKVVRVEQSGLGTVFMCTHGGSRYGTTGCRRTYLSQRDLQAHINHRHVSLAVSAIGESKASDAKASPGLRKGAASDAGLSSSAVGRERTESSGSATSASANSCASNSTAGGGGCVGRGNLITVSIQDSSSSSLKQPGTPTSEYYFNVAKNQSGSAYYSSAGGGSGSSHSSSSGNPPLLQLPTIRSTSALHQTKQFAQSSSIYSLHQSQYHRTHDGAQHFSSGQLSYGSALAAQWNQQNQQHYHR